MRRAFLFLFCISAPVAVFVFATHHSKPKPQQFISSVPSGLQSAQAYLLPLAEPAYAPVRDTTVAEPELDANAAVLYDVDTGAYLYEKNDSMKVPIASLTKLLSVLVVQDVFDPNDIVTVASGSVRVDGQKQTLYNGERLTVHDLVSMMLVESSNDAAYALAHAAKERGVDFVVNMNQKAVVLGMSDCLFKDPAGLDDTAYCTAHDLVRLVRAALRIAPQIWPIMATKELTVLSADRRIVHTVKSTDELLGQIAGIVGGKTGYTDGALGCLILVVKIPAKTGTLISIVLGSRQRFTDTQTLSGWAQRAYFR